MSNFEYLLFIQDKFLFIDNFINIINDLKKEYDYILIDTSSNYKNKYFKKILEISDNIFFIIVPTICEIKKAIDFFEIIKEDYKVPIEKIRLIVNKENNYSIDSNIIKKIFGIKKINRYC